jgi:uncharacterized protein YjiS (DUF1127 family)
MKNDRKTRCRRANRAGVQAMALLLAFAVCAGEGATPAPAAPGRPAAVAAESRCMRPVLRVNRVYQRRNGSYARWRPADTVKHTLAQLPRAATARNDGTFVEDGNLFVRLQTQKGTRVAQVLPDGTGYRMLLQDGSPGPLVALGNDGRWELSPAAPNYLKGSVLSEVVGADITADARTLHRAALMLEQVGTPEQNLIELHRTGTESQPAAPLLLLSLGHGFIESLPARLRDPAATVWNARELRLIAANLAARARRPLALFVPGRRRVFAVLADGTEWSSEALPPDTLRLKRRESGRYFAVDDRWRTLSPDHESIFAALEQSVRPSSDTRPLTPEQREAEFRGALADELEARSTRPELERMHEQWIDDLGLSSERSRILKELSRLRHAIVDPHETLTPDQELRLLEAGDSVIRDAMLTGQPFGLLAPERVLPKIVDQDSGLLPQALDYLLVKDAAVLEMAREHGADEWTMGGRHYVRLRHAGGRTQVVETRADAGNDEVHEILAPVTAPERGSGRYIVRRGGLWFPDDWLRDGYAPMDPKEHLLASAAIGNKLPVAYREDVLRIGRIADSVPPPLLRFFRRGLVDIDTASDGGLVFSVRHPETGQPMRYLTHLDMEGHPVARTRPQGTAAAVSAPPPADTQLVLPVPRLDGTPRLGPAPDPAAYVGLLKAEEPVSAFVRMGVGDRHVSALVATRRLRGMLREDTNMALVGGNGEHVFTMVLPVNAESIALTDIAAHGGGVIGQLPEGTIIIDPMYGVTAHAADYPARVRDVARRWEASGGKIARLRPDGSEEAESPVAFTERLLATPVRPILWSPGKDPISETGYVQYMRRRYVDATPVVHAGLDWLGTKEARRDYMTYFAPPAHIMPFAGLSGSTNAQAAKMQALADVAVEVGLRPVAVRRTGTLQPGTSGTAQR